MSVATFKSRNLRDLHTCKCDGRKFWFVLQKMRLKELRYYVLSFCLTCMKHIGMKFRAGALQIYRTKSQWCKLEMQTGSEMVWEVRVECEEQMKGALPSLPPSKQESRAACSHTTAQSTAVFPEAEQNHMVDLALWNFWAPSKQSRQNWAANEIRTFTTKEKTGIWPVCLLGCVSAAPLRYQRSYKIYYT